MVRGIITQHMDMTQIGREFLERWDFHFDKHEKSSLLKKFWTKVLIGI
jgi:hypothetical protein